MKKKNLPNKQKEQDKKQRLSKTTTQQIKGTGQETKVRKNN